MGRGTGGDKQVSKTLEVKGLILGVAQKSTGKHKNNPHTEFVIGVPLLPNGKMEEVAFADGYTVCLKIEYLPRKGWEYKEKKECTCTPEIKGIFAKCPIHSITKLEKKDVK